MSFLLLFLSDSTNHSPTPTLLTASISPNYDGVKKESHAVYLFVTTPTPHGAAYGGSETLSTEAPLGHLPTFILCHFRQVPCKHLPAPHPDRETPHLLFPPDSLVKSEIERPIHATTVYSLIYIAY